MRSAIILTVLVAGIGCGGSAEQAGEQTSSDTAQTSTPPAAATRKACDLITVEELMPLVKLELKPGRTTNDYGGASQCRWDRASGTQDGVSISLHEHGDITNYSGVPGSQAVSGLGDQAVWNQGLNQLAVRVGERVMSVSLLYPPPSPALTRQIAEVALTRLNGQ